MSLSCFNNIRKTSWKKDKPVYDNFTKGSLLKQYLLLVYLGSQATFMWIYVIIILDIFLEKRSRSFAAIFEENKSDTFFLKSPNILWILFNLSWKNSIRTTYMWRRTGSEDKTRDFFSRFLLHFSRLRQESKAEQDNSGLIYMHVYVYK